MFPERLTKGYRSFLGGRFASERARYQDLASSGQSPSIMVIGCVDSRVSPEVIFDAAPGELLVARNVANLVPRYEPPTTPDTDISHQHGTSAALEFAVRALKVKHIVVTVSRGLAGPPPLPQPTRPGPHQLRRLQTGSQRLKAPCRPGFHLAAAIPRPDLRRVSVSPPWDPTIVAANRRRSRPPSRGRPVRCASAGTPRASGRASPRRCAGSRRRPPRRASRA